MANHDKYYETLHSISKIVNSALGNGQSQEGRYTGAENGGPAATDFAEHHENRGQPKAAAASDTGCTLKSLPLRLQTRAAELARQINPFNAPSFIETSMTTNMEIAMSLSRSPAFLTALTTKYFGRVPRDLTVSFLEPEPQDLQRRIVQHMNAWNNCCGIRFVLTNETGQVRITLSGSGYWSYVGTDIFFIPPSNPTLNLQGFTMGMPEEEFTRVVRHEAGHTIGFTHEHMRRELIARIDREKAYRYFWETQGWDRATVDQQVLTPLDENSILGTAPDEDSIMCYQLPGSITKDGRPIRGGTDINRSDCRFASSIYPTIEQYTAGAQEMAAHAGPDTLHHHHAPHDDHQHPATDWSPDQDVSFEAALTLADSTARQPHARSH